MGTPNIIHTSAQFQWKQSDYLKGKIPSIAFPSSFQLPDKSFDRFPFQLSASAYTKFSSKAKTPGGVVWRDSHFTYNLTFVQKVDNALVPRGRSASNKREADDFVGEGLPDKSKYTQIEEPPRDTEHTWY